ncbi:MAG: ATPase [Bacteroidetes bacterium]|nr:ATPase [Bacteroidota bacterium]
MSKSHVTMEQKMCPVTGEVWNTESLLFDKRLKKRFEMNTVTGYAFSPKVQEQIDKGFIALVEINEEKSVGKDGKAKMEDAWRTGRLCYLKEEVAKNIFGEHIQQMNFIGEDMFEKLMKENDNTKEENDITEKENGSKDGKS